MLCIGGKEKQKDIKKGNELPFLISFSFLRDLRSHTGMRERSAHRITFIPIQSSLEGARGKPLCEREVPPKKLSAGMRETQRTLFNPLILGSLERVRGKPLCEREVPPKKLSAGMRENQRTK